jgi:hypothetical protein
MLKHIPFYASLLGRELKDGSKTTTSHVLVYGAIEAHSYGEKGCIASNALIAQESGLSLQTVKNVITGIAQIGWIKPVYTDETKQFRLRIDPLLEIQVPSPKGGTRTPQSTPPYSPEYGTRTPQSTRGNSPKESSEGTASAPEKIEEPEDDIELVPEEDTVRYSAFERAKKPSGWSQPKSSAKLTKLSSLGKELQDTFKEWANISSLDGDYNDRDTEDFIILFKADLLRFNYTMEELDAPTVVKEFKALLKRIKDPFHKNNLTSMSYLKRNFQRILKDVDN